MPTHHIRSDYLPMQENSLVFRLDHLQTNDEDLTKGGIMMVCHSSLHPVRINIPHPSELEVLSIMVATHTGCSMFV